MIEPNKNQIIVIDRVLTQLVTHDISQPLVLSDSGRQGPPGRQGDPGIQSIVLTASSSLSGHRVIRADGAGGASYADCTSVAQVGSIIGISTYAAPEGAQIDVLYAGPITEPSWNWMPGLPVFVGSNGQLTQTLPMGATFMQVVGEVISPTTLNLDFSDPILL